MNKKYTLVIFVSFLAAATGVLFVVIKNWQSKPMENQQMTIGELTPTASQTTPSPAIETDKKQDASTMVTKIAQITLTVSSPSNNATVTNSKVSVKGKTLAKAEVFANEAEGVADANGNFSLSVSLDEGPNDIIVTAVDGNGNVAETVVTVTYDAGE